MSWIIVSRETGKPVFETFNRRIPDAINHDKYEVLSAEEWLMRFNAEVVVK